MPYAKLLSIELSTLHPGKVGKANAHHKRPKQGLKKRLSKGSPCADSYARMVVYWGLYWGLLLGVWRFARAAVEQYGHG